MHEGKKVMNSIPEEIMAYIIQVLQDICYGEITLIIQDRRIIQIERSEKLHFEQCRLCLSKHMFSNSEIEHVKGQITAYFQHLAYGKIVIVVKNTRITGIERTEKQRFKELDNMNFKTM
jgi:hypothetical protein